VLLSLVAILIVAVSSRPLIYAFETNLGFVLLSKTINSQTQHNLLADAETWFQRSETMSDSMPVEAYQGLGLVAFHAGDDENASAHFRKAGLSAADMLAYGHTAAALNQPEDAQRWYKLTTQQFPNMGDAWYYLGLMYQEQGLLSQAQSAYAAGVSAPDRIEIGSSDLYFGLADMARLQNNYAYAQHLYEQALQSDSFSFQYAKVNTLDQLAAIYIRQQKYQKAIPLLEQAIDRSPSFDWPYFRLGTAYYLCCQDTERAISYLNQGIETSPDNPWGYVLLGDIYLAEGDRELARTLFRKSLELRPNWTVAEERLLAMDQ